MNATRWERVRDLVAEALDLEPQARAALVASRAGGDRDLELEALSLLEEDRRAERLFAAADRARQDPQSPLAEGQVFERWRLERKLGEGGMGVVWLARRDDTGQRVALKLVHLPLVTASARRRFDVERRALARLEHPGITRLVDAGVSAIGLPFLAMEFVDGAPIGSWCDARQLDVRARVALFRHVCDAVHAAHQRLVVHGDIKPSNVLVDDDGRVRLCDFGIARLLDAQDDSGTRSVQRAMTPRYASPEQVRGEPLSTASDIYSLGCLLYELLSGVAAQEPRTGSTAELERAVCEQSATRPSHAAARATSAALAARGLSARTLAQALEADLDAIVLRCLAKEPGRRYASAAELADDLGRHLHDEPIRARAERTHEVAARFVRRHRLPVALAALAVIGLAGGLAIALDSAQATRAALEREQSARALAERRYGAVRELATTLVFDAHDAIRNLPGSTRAREALADVGARHLDQLALDAGDDPELLRELARAQLRLADALGRPVEASLGRTAEARERYQRAIELADRDSEDLALRAWARAKLADLYLHESRVADAEPLYGEALELRQRFEARAPEAWGTNPTLGYLLERRAELATRQGHFDTAHEHAQQAVAWAERALALQPAEPAWAESLAVALSRVATVALARREPERAIESLERALAALEPLAAAPEAEARVLQRAAQAKGDLGAALARARRQEDALAQLEDAVQLHRALHARDSASAAYRDDLAVALRRLGTTLAASGRPADAVASLTEAVALARLNAAIPGAGAKAWRALAVAADELGGVLLKLERDDEALALHAESNAVFAALAESSPTEASAQRGLAVSLAMLGDARLAAAARPGLSDDLRNERRALAAEAFRSALEIVERLASEGALPASDSHVPAWLSEKLTRALE